MVTASGSQATKASPTRWPRLGQAAALARARARCRARVIVCASRGMPVEPAGLVEDGGAGRVVRAGRIGGFEAADRVSPPRRVLSPADARGGRAVRPGPALGAGGGGGATGVRRASAAATARARPA